MKILIADDDADDRTLAALAFKEVAPEHELEFVTDGQELLDYLRGCAVNKQLLPDLILLDLNMPKKDGRIALKELKSDATIRHLDVIIFSTSASAADKDYTLKMGARNYLVKPSDFTTLIRIFKDLISTTG